MSTPKEKAQDLIKTFVPYADVDKEGDAKAYARKCAEACVNEIIMAIYNIEADDMPVHNGTKWVNAVDYYKAIKEELLNP